jgi:hypothetical protein
MTSNSVIKRSEYFIIIGGLLLLSILLGLYIASERVDVFEITARVQVAEQQAVLNTIAETIARNGADSVTESIVRDCPIVERMRFDTLLGQLDSGLAVTELRELDGLFNSCASFLSDRKSLMSARFSREIEAYEAQVALLNILTTTDESKAAHVAQWKALVTEEQKQSMLFAQLVTAQRQIIDALIDGKSAGSDDIVAILTDVNETKEALVYSRQQADQIRSTVSSL